MRSAAAVCGVVLAGVLVACGGGGVDAPPPTPLPAPPPRPPAPVEVAFAGAKRARYFLEVSLRVKNKSAGLRVSLDRDELGAGAKLRDEHGNAYKLFSYDGTHKFDPGKTETVVLWFDHPVEAAKSFTVAFPEKALGGEASREFRFSRDDIKVGE